MSIKTTLQPLKRTQPGNCGMKYRLYTEQNQRKRIIALTVYHIADIITHANVTESKNLIIVKTLNQPRHPEKE